MIKNKFDIGDSVKIEYHFKPGYYYYGFILEYDANSECSTYFAYCFDKEFENFLCWPARRTVKCHNRVLLTEKKYKIGEHIQWLNQMG